MNSIIYLLGMNYHTPPCPLPQESFLCFLHDRLIGRIAVHSFGTLGTLSFAWLNGTLLVHLELCSNIEEGLIDASDALYKATGRTSALSAAVVVRPENTDTHIMSLKELLHGQHTSRVKALGLAHRH